MNSGLVFGDRLSHNAETAHRLPHLGGKCVALHGHSWQITVDVEVPQLVDGIGVEFGRFKAGLRGWIDEHLDHGVMLGVTDPLVAAISGIDGMKVFRFGAGHDAVGAETLAADLAYPTVENVAALIRRVAEDVLTSCPRPEGGFISTVQVRETATNLGYARAAGPAQAAPDVHAPDVHPTPGVRAAGEAAA